MCSRTKCRTCGKPTWSGCGQHVEQALKGVAKNQRCTCDRNAKSQSSGDSFFARLFGGK